MPFYRAYAYKVIQYNHIVAISQQDGYNKMKLEEDLKAVRYIRERIDLIVNDEGYVILPAWQFALFVREYENYRSNTIVMLVMFLMIVVWILFFTTTLF